MTRTILLTFTLLCCTAWMVAQNTPASSAPSSSPSSTTQAGSQSNTDSSAMGQTSAGQTSAGQSSASDQAGSEQTLQGCLASAGGSYTLKDASGTEYQLGGDTSKLSAHVNSEVEVKGTPASGASASNPGSSSGSSASSSSTPSNSAAAARTFTVTNVKKISGTCGSSK